MESKNRVVKTKDPENTAKAQEELEQEGKSIVEEKNVTMNEDKLSGKGSLSVRFEVTSPGRKSFSEKKLQNSSKGEDGGAQ